MEMKISGRHARRAALRLLPLTALVLLGACTVSTSGDTTTVTISTAKIDAYGKVGISAVTTILSVAAVASAIGAPTVAIITAAGAAVTAALAGFDNATNGSVSFTLDDTSALTAAKSVVTSLSALLADLKSAASSLSGKIGSNDLANVTTSINAAETALALVEALLGFVAASPSAPQVRMGAPAMFKAVGLPVPDWAR